MQRRDEPLEKDFGKIHECAERRALFGKDKVSVSNQHNVTFGKPLGRVEVLLCFNNLLDSVCMMDPHDPRYL